MAIILPGEQLPAAPVTLPTDSLLMARKAIDKYSVDTKGRPRVFDSTAGAQPKDLVSSVKFLRGYITKHKDALDQEYARRKAADENFPGLSEREIKDIIGEDGVRYMDAIDLFTKYRKMTNKGGSAYEEEESERKTYNPPSMDGSGKATTIRYYSPERGASALGAGKKLGGSMIPRIVSNP